MAVVSHPQAVLGLNIGGINTRVSLFSIFDGKYRLFGSQSAQTSLGHGQHVGAGVGLAMQTLQERMEYAFLKDEGGLILPANSLGGGVDQVALTISAGPRVRTALLGLSRAGSIKAGRILIESLPLQPVATLGMENLAHEARAIETLIKSHPEILIITGGEDNGAQELIQQWIEITRTLCSLLPESSKPAVIYAGNPKLEPQARRHLEPVSRVQISPNLQPVRGHFDLVPTQGVLEPEILRIWTSILPGLTDLSGLAKDLIGVSGPAYDRMMRFLSLTRHHDQVKSTRTGFLAVDLGGFYTTVAAGLGGLSGTVMQDKFPDMASAEWSQAGHMLVDYASEAVTREDAEQFLSNYVLIPAWVPATRRELALSQAFACYRLRQALERFSNNYSWFDYHPERGLQGQYEPIIVCGGVLTGAPDPYGLTLTLLDGIQPYGITTLVLDRYNVLSLLGEIGETEPVLPVHLLSSATFENLGTVVSAAGRVPAGKTALSVQLETASGETGSLEVPMGSLTRLDIPPGETAELELIPHHHVDIGFGGYGHKGRLRVRGGTLGVIIDARGRPVQVPERGEARVALIQQWLRALGPNHD